MTDLQEMPITKEDYTELMAKYRNLYYRHEEDAAAHDQLVQAMQQTIDSQTSRMKKMRKVLDSRASRLLSALTTIEDLKFTVAARDERINRLEGFITGLKAKLQNL